MKTTRMMCRLALGALLAVGCDRSENTPKSPTPAPPPPDVTPKAGTAGTGDANAGSGATAGGSGTASGSGALPGETAAPAAAAPTTRPTAADAAPAAEDMTKQAQEQIDKAMAAMKEKRFAEARQSLDKVEAMGGDVPTALREQVDTMRKSLDNLEKAPAGAVPPPLPAPDEENK